MEFTDDDGLTFTVSQGSGINSGVDHQTIGGGPLAAPLTGNPDFPEYKNGVWYCAQDVAYANCALSTDGGKTFGPAVPIYTVARLRRTTWSYQSRGGWHPLYSKPRMRRHAALPRD